MTLHVPTVLETQWQKLCVTEFATLPALDLIAKLSGAIRHEGLVEFVVTIHGGCRNAGIRWTWSVHVIVPRNTVKAADDTQTSVAV
ncbi:hypothetical protein BVI1335_110054 [Burkholderia vietnamiensis]|nr:hypothetical protein BVI1335_110054 [Burkholderia vietnamiensis]